MGVIRRWFAGNMGRSGKRPKAELKPGFLAEFLIKRSIKTIRCSMSSLTQVPEVQASIVTINAKNGEIVCMVGGYDFHTSKFNNATQGLRQTGSAYKPFIYTAAVEDGMTPDMTVAVHRSNAAAGSRTTTTAARVTATCR